MTPFEQKLMNGVPAYAQRGMSKKAFQAGMYFRGDLRMMAEQSRQYSAQDVVDGSTPAECSDMQRWIEEITKHCQAILECINSKQAKGAH